MLDYIPYFIIWSSILAILYWLILIVYILKLPTGNKKMQDIATAIQQWAKAFLNRQYFTIAIVAIVLFFIIWFVPKLGWLTAMAFIVWAILSWLTGYIGMNISVRANVRTTEAAKKWLASALDVAVKWWNITWMLVVWLALLWVSWFYFISKFYNIPDDQIIHSIIWIWFWWSLISVFARLWGWIFTKAADVWADLVGKVEAWIPEDDPRNPAVIADNVWDNVWDCAGMAADLFETYVVTIIAAMILWYTIFAWDMIYILYPLVLWAASIIFSIVWSFCIKLWKNKNIMFALYKWLIASWVLAAFAFYVITKYLILENSLNLYFASLIGLALTAAMVVITEYFTSTSYSPVRQIAEASKTWHGTNVIAGLAVSMKSTGLPIIVIVLSILWSFYFAWIYGIAIAAVSMLSMAGIIVTIDSYWPITDNAWWIAEMAELDKKVRAVTDPLDAVGNTTKAVTKWYAIWSAALAALVLFSDYAAKTAWIDFSINNPYVLSGLFIGWSLPYYFAALSMQAVWRAASTVVEDVRDQFKNNKWIMTGKSKPDYGRTVDIVTKAALKEMIFPALIPVLIPIIVYFWLGIFVSVEIAKQALWGILIWSIITWIFVAISMTNGWWAWDNAKKYIESWFFGGKWSDAHKAAVTWDTVWDPYKDTAGPAINPMIKIINIIALLIVWLL